MPNLLALALLISSPWPVPHPRLPVAEGSVPRAGGITEVAVLGMIHDRHRHSRTWGLDQVRDTIRRIAPDAVCAEIPPDRWPRAWSEFTRTGVVTEERVARFPEITDVLLPLAAEAGFEVVPCAAWTKEMADDRRSRLGEFRTRREHAKRRAEYERRLAEIEKGHSHSLAESEDPRAIHSDRYDLQVREEMELYDEFLGELLGPGGWSRINEAHMKLIDRAIRAHRGRRLLVAFGAGHKYWFLDRLRERRDVRLIDVGPYLPPDPTGAPAGRRAVSPDPDP